MSTNRAKRLSEEKKHLLSSEDDYSDSPADCIINISEEDPVSFVLKDRDLCRLIFSYIQFPDLLPFSYVSKNIRNQYNQYLKDLIKFSAEMPATEAESIMLKNFIQSVIETGNKIPLENNGYQNTRLTTERNNLARLNNEKKEAMISLANTTATYIFKFSLAGTFFCLMPYIATQKDALRDVTIGLAILSGLTCLFASILHFRFHCIKNGTREGFTILDIENLGKKIKAAEENIKTIKRDTRITANKVITFFHQKENATNNTTVPLAQNCVATLATIP